jgi:uncharacterized protein (DUF433 family)
MTGSPLTTQVPEWLEAVLRVEFAKLGHSPSEGLRHVLQEWWMMKNLPDLEWRKGVTGPRPAIRGGPEVWEVVMTYRDYEGDFESLADHYDWATQDQLRQALAFYELMPEPIDEHLEENLRIERLHMGEGEA